jgi:hypothetical protein
MCLLTTVQARNSPRVTISTTSTATSANAATNVTTQTRNFADTGHDDDLEEEGGDDFVDIDDMLLEELDLSGHCDGCYDSHCDGCYDSHYDSCCEPVTAATTARTVAAILFSNSHNTTSY